MKKRYFLLLLSLSFFTFSCQSIFDCVIPVEAELPNAQFPIGSTETYYYKQLTGEVNNEPRDDDYDYFFDVFGLPEGMDYFVNYRTISIEGRPVEAGTYDITISLFVEGPFNDNNESILCDQETSKTYTIIIE
ncbi:hypothetical protein [Winogradskyella sp.]|uniref:hypothetical protein n=1 Tax=Winogradskyella sp. TaxID=1883156 RepID=UPI003BA86160